MIVSDRHELLQLLNGERIDVVVSTRPPHVGATLSAQPAVGHPTACRATVLDVWPHASGGHVVALGAPVVVLQRPAPPRAVKIVKRVEPVRLMKRGGGETSKPEQGMRDSTGMLDELYGREPEPEMVPRDWKDPGANVRYVQQAVLDRATRERLSFGEQLDGLLAEARSFGDQRFAREIRRLEAAGAALERQLSRERAQRAA